jgi:tRNA pseudouridine55 synthase
MVGILNLHKPPDLTSRRAVDVISRLAKTKRVGHAGTLDPLASGVLLICVGWATRLVSFLQDRPKSYSARFLLGRRSDTEDTTGVVNEVPGVLPPHREQLEAALQSFVGTIMQVPPQFSAVHVAGERAYAAARQGRHVEIQPRPVEIFRIVVRDYDYPEVAVDIECGSGTYIRAIGRDLGDALGCGAVMSSLVRTAIGEFTLASAQSLVELEQSPQALPSRLQPPLRAVSHLPCLNATPEECLALRQGKRLLVARPEWSAGNPIAVVDPEGELLALGEYLPDSGCLQPRQVFPKGAAE